MAEYYASTWKSTHSGNTRYFCGYIYYNWYPEYSATTSLFEITGLGIRQTSSGKTNWSGGTASASASCDGQPTLSASRALSGNEWNWSGAGNKSLWSGSWCFWYGRTTYAYYPYVTVAGAKTGGSAWSGSASSAFQIGIPALPAYTVSYNANGGTGAPAAQTKWYGINLALSSTAPTRTGYTFAGWSTTQGGSVVYQPGATYSANGGATLWAVWTANTWTISYDANGGTGSIADQTKTYDQTLTLSDGTGISRTNHSLIEWNTMPSGSGDVYAKGEVLNETFAQSLSLYAQWHLDYIAPVITNFNAYRVDSASSSTETDDGEYIYVTFDYRAGTADSGTTWETPHCKIIIDGDASHPVFDSDLIISSGEGTFPSSTIAFGTYSKDTTHSVQISLFDSYNVISGAYTEIATATYPIDLYGNGTDVYMGIMTPHVIGQMLTLPEETYIDGTKLGPGGGGGGTSVPTANKVAKFDSTAHMNSTDMTSQEIDDFVDSIGGGGGGYLPSFEYVGNMSSYVINSSWTATDDGIAIVRATWDTTGQFGYWYVSDTTDGLQICNLGGTSNGTTLSAMIPIIKGHSYVNAGSAHVYYAFFYFYKFK